ncbi:putative Peroxidase 48 [Prunus yedoensis var. nudiflora]|uniref:Putative Peroxidase 48 n=1 Tax=Prunus yedoensis var. nudiflora TaxID=2094558 RepID=A0A314UJB2_PRUYE|nr:putative Peroxidase 48 [Prunus yedoensis var. nudiflora]
MFALGWYLVLTYLLLPPEMALFCSSSYFPALLAVLFPSAGGPFYPLFTGRRDSARSYYDEATAEIPKPDDNITQTLHLSHSEEGTTLGRLDVTFIQSRLNNFKGTGKPDPTVSPSFLNEMRVFCEDNGNKKSSQGSPMAATMASPMEFPTAAPWQHPWHHPQWHQGA